MSAFGIFGGSKRTLSLGLAFAGLASLVSPHARAANDAWSTAPAGNTFTGNNWTTGVTVPGAANGTIASGDTLFFGTSNTTALLDDEAAGFNIGSITFNAGASAFTINGTNQNNLAGNIVNNGSVTQTINVPLALTANRSVTGNATGGNTTFGGVISGAFAISFRGTGATNTLTNANTFVGTGNSEILDGSTLRLDFSQNVTQNNIFPTTQTIAVGTSVAATAQSNTLAILGSSTQASAQTFATTTIRNMSRINLTAGTGQTLNVTFGTLTGNNGNGGASNFSIGNNVTVNLTAVAVAPSASGVVLGNGNYTLGTVGENTWATTTATTTTAGTLTGFTGYTVDSVGTTANDADIQTNGLTLTGNQRTLRFNTAGVSTLNVSGTRQITNGGVLMTANANQNLTITDGGTATNLLQGVSNRGLYVYQYNATNSLTIDASITANGSAGLNKMGAGALILTKANTYAGSTLVQEGALVVNGGVAGTSSGTGTGTNFSLAPGARLAGIGVIAPVGTPAAGATTASVNIGGVVAPGTGTGVAATIGNGSVGMLTFNLTGGTQTAPVAGVMNIAATASFQMELGAGGGTFAAPGNSDRILILGSANNTSGVDVVFNNNIINLLGTGQPGVYKLFDVDANTTYSGQAGLTVTNLAAGYTGTIVIGDGTTGDLGDIYLQVAPEPGTWALVAGGIGLLMVMQRRRSRVC